MFQQVEKQLVCLLEKSVDRYCRDSSLKPPDPAVFQTLSLEIPKEKEFGDFSSTVALRLASLWRKNPGEVAGAIVAIAKTLLAKSPAKALVKDIEVKGAGFINIFLTDKVFFDTLKDINTKSQDAGKTDLGRGQRVLVEFVSANPTGPLSVAHARQAAVGDALANILSLAGHQVKKEYYLNDEGNQINILGRSIDLRYRELSGQTVDTPRPVNSTLQGADRDWPLGHSAQEPPGFSPGGLHFPENHYQGQYIVDLAKALYVNDATRKKIEGLDADGRASFFIDYGVEEICGMIRQELDDFGVHFDAWYSQKELGRSGKIEKALAFLKKKGLLYEAEGALWFKSAQFGDDKDRVVRKSDGAYTYITPDIAYHEDKFKRGFQRLINLWGPDHHGYIPRIRAAVQAFGKDKAALDIVIIQLATLFRQGQPVPMSTRKGEYVTLREVLTEVGRDASRFFFLMRKTDSHLDFDLELAKKQSPENPVYYIQYAHARIASILAGAGRWETDPGKVNWALLAQPEERDLARALLGFAVCVMVCANQLDPYPLTTYLQSLAALFHKFYDRHKVLSSDEELTRSRLFLIRAVKIVLAKGLALAGVSAPEKM